MLQRSLRPLFLTAPLVALVASCDDEAAQMLLTCEGGNVEACYAEGVALISHARPQYSEARRSFSSACMKDIHPTLKTGDPERARAQWEARAKSCHALGRLVRDAKGGPKDLPRAVDLFEIACKAQPDGSQTQSTGPVVPEACVDLAHAIYDSEGIPPEPERAVELVRTACQSDPPDHRACTLLGTAFYAGKGMRKKDIERALELFEASCASEYAPACVKAGDLLAARTRNDASLAAAAYSKGCALDARLGCYELADLHAKKGFPGASNGKASEYYQKTCSIDPTRGCFEAAQLMLEGKVLAREGQIESLFNTACDHGHTEACAKRQLDRQQLQRVMQRK